MNDRQSLTVDLIIPALNEQDNIPVLLATLPTARLRHVIVVDNGSTDRTAEVARCGGAVVVLETHRGYGSACLAGLAWITEHSDPPDAIAFIDADLADDPAALWGLCQPITDQGMDLVVGSRRQLAAPAALTLPQRVGNNLACGMLRLLTGQRYTDLGPMRVVRWSSLERLGMSDRTWGWTVEMQFKAAAMSMHIMELDVPYRTRHAGESKISGSLIVSIRAGWKILATITKLWWLHRGCRRSSRAASVTRRGQSSGTNNQ